MKTFLVLTILFAANVASANAIQCYVNYADTKGIRMPIPENSNFDRPILVADADQLLRSNQPVKQSVKTPQLGGRLDVELRADTYRVSAQPRKLMSYRATAKFVAPEGLSSTTLLAPVVAPEVWPGLEGKVPVRVGVTMATKGKKVSEIVLSCESVD